MISFISRYLNFLKSCLLLLDLHRRWTLVAPWTFRRILDLSTPLKIRLQYYEIFNNTRHWGSFHWPQGLRESLSCVQISRRLQHSSSLQNYCNTSLSGRADHGAGWGRQGWAGIFPPPPPVPFIAAMAESGSVGGFCVRKKKKKKRYPEKKKSFWSLFLTAEIILTTLETKSKPSIKL